MMHLISGNGCSRCCFSSVEASVLGHESLSTSWCVLISVQHFSIMCAGFEMRYRSILLFLLLSVFLYIFWKRIPAKHCCTTGNCGVQGCQRPATLSKHTRNLWGELLVRKLHLCCTASLDKVLFLLCEQIHYRNGLRFCFSVFKMEALA